MDYDVIVIGSGLAGTAAAVNAARTKKVAVIRKGYGATALSSGSFDIAGGPAYRGRPFKNIAGVSAGVQHVLENKTEHPYSIISQMFASDRIDKFTKMVRIVTTEFFERLADSGVAYEGSWTGNMVLPTQHGSFKIVSMCQSSMQSGNLVKLLGRSILFLGFEKTAIHSKIRSQFLKNMLSKYGLLSVKDIAYANIDLQSAGLEWDGHDFISLAGIMDSPDNAKKVVACIKETADKLGSDHIFIPPIMGIKNHLEVLKLFGDAFGSAISEFIAAPPSAPGLRLQYALDNMLRQHGVTVIDGRVNRGSSDNVIREVNVVLGDGSKKVLSAGSFVLATGKFIGGGIVKGRIWQEKAFELPPFINGRPVNDPFTLKYLTDDPFDEQALFSIGVKINDNLKPVDEDGRVVYENLYAAGSVISGYNYIYDGTGMGTALITGAKAGMFSAERI